MQNRIKVVAAGMAAALICMTIVFYGNEAVMRCEAKTGDAEKEVVDFVTAYYEAQTPEGIETLADYVSDPESMDFMMSLVSLQTAFEHGMTGLENIDVIVYPLSDGEYWVASVSTEMAVQGFDVTLPGLKVELVDRKPDGKLQILVSSDELDENNADALLKELREISLSDEMVDRNNEIAMKYSEIVVDYPDVAQWVLEMSQAGTEAKAEAYGRISQGMYDVKGAERDESDNKENRYLVKKGDCLWSIAEEQLGDGMLWGDIYEANKMVIGEDPNLIYVGIELTLQ